MCLTPAATAARWTATRSGRSLTRHQEQRAHAGKRGLHRLGVGLIDQDRDLGAGQIRCANRIRHDQPLPVAARGQQRRNLAAHLTGRVGVTDQASHRSPLKVADQARARPMPWILARQPGQLNR
jgi:hypothetical protein